MRWDLEDSERTHVDLRELYWRRSFASADLYIGLRKLFWGVTESVHLVDVVNQTDLVENTDTFERHFSVVFRSFFTNIWQWGR